MSYSHMRNFTITIALTKTFPSELNDSSLILVTRFYVTNDKIYTKKLLQIRPKTMTWRKKRKKKKRKDCKPFGVTRKKFTQKYTMFIILYYKVPPKFILWASRKTKMPKYTIFFRTSHSVDNHGGSSTTSNISFHFTGTWSCLKMCLRLNTKRSF